MPKASRTLKLRDGLAWVGILARSRRGPLKYFSFVLDTGTAHTVLHATTARSLGITGEDKLGTADFDAIGHSEPGHTVRLSSFISCGREVNNYLVGVVEFQSRIDVPGILGLDFFLETDLLLAFRRGEVVLDW